MEQARIRYSYGAPLMMYPVGHQLMSRDISYRPDESYYDVIEGYVVEDEMLTSLDEYRSFVAEAMHVLDAANREVREIYPKTVAQMKYAADRFHNSAVREAVLHHIATTYVDNFGVKDITEIENLYHTYVKDASMLESMKAKYDRWDLSRPGRMSPGFRASDVDGKEYTLADFRGRYVYIDMWATWCGPCRREMPYLKALEEEFADAQIVFLGLSIDKDKQAWENMVREGGLTGIQLYLGLQSRFQEAYRIESIPRFILLDKEGRIIENDMSRPSEDITAEKLRNLKDIR
jgi:thiol-disulfide isomerase/thioredoxin